MRSLGPYLHHFRSDLFVSFAWLLHLQIALHGVPAYRPEFFPEGAGYASELMDLQARLGTTFVIVTHDQEEAMTVADRIAVMNHGRIAQVATPPELYEQPLSCWVAQFIGDVNLIEGGVIEAGNGAATIEDGAGRRYRITNSAIAPGARVFIALRPEKLRIATAPDPAAGENAVRGRVWDVGYLGGMSIYKVRLDDGTEMKAAVANVTRRVEPAIGPGQDVVLSWAPGAAVVLTG
jgi:putrescine transport system ATP-binding protein